MDNGLTLAMSPVQLAAVLSDKTVTQAETFSGRLMGGLDLIMGGVELAGATALCMVPEPTGLTKFACVAGGAHSLDSINTAANRIITGQDTRTATYRAAAALAKEFGADDETAWKIGLTVDIAVPVAFGLAIGATRIAYVRSGTLKLIEHEAVVPVKAGGHTITKHIAIPKEDLLARLAHSPQMQSVSSFYSVQQAEKVVSSAMRANRLKIIYWANFSSNSRPLELTWKTSTAVGYGFRQGKNVKETSYAVRVVLLKKVFNGKPYYVLTSYPWMG